MRKNKLHKNKPFLAMFIATIMLSFSTDQICEIETNKRLSKLHNNKSKEVQMTGKDDYDDDSDDSEDEDRLSPNDLAKLGNYLHGPLLLKDIKTL